jgi:hypothetical protein
LGTSTTSPALVVRRLRAAQAGDAARGRIAIRAGLADGLLELLDDVDGGRQVGIAHPEVDDVRTAVPRHRLGAVHLLENVGRQAPDAEEVFHDRFMLRVARSRLVAPISITV